MRNQMNIQESTIHSSSLFGVKLGIWLLHSLKVYQLPSLETEVAPGSYAEPQF
jgi:hypothetical protein